MYSPVVMWVKQVKCMLFSSQVENEYGSYYTCDHEYMTHLQTLFEQYLGKDVILYTTDGSSDRMINCGSLPTLFTTVDFGAGKESKAELHGVLSTLYSRRGIE